jgi:hypothetical protein
MGVFLPASYSGSMIKLWFAEKAISSHEQDKRRT